MSKTNEFLTALVWGAVILGVWEIYWVLEKLDDDFGRIVIALEEIEKTMKGNGDNGRIHSS